MAFEQLSQEQIAANDAKSRENLETTLNKLSELAIKYGYKEVSALEELGLSPEQLRQISWVDPDPTRSNPNRKFYQAERTDGGQVKLIAAPAGYYNNFIAADFFTPAFTPSGHGGNHDFNYKEMEGNMQLALELSAKK